MNVSNVKIGETFTKDGILYEMTKNGIKRLSDDSIVNATDGEIIIERQILKG